MKPQKLLFAAVLIWMAVSYTLMAENFRTKGSGNWTNPASWQIQSGESWNDATTFPGQTNGIEVVTIQAGHKLYISPGADITIKDITVQASRKLTVHPGGKVSVVEKMELLANPSAAIEIGGVQPSGSITTLDCAGATASGTLNEGEAADGVSVVIPYTGGSGGTHYGQTVQSIGVTGLTAVLDAGTFASGSGKLTYIILGTPAEAGNAVFGLSIGGKICDITISIVPFCEPEITFTYRGQEVTYGSIYRNGLCWMDRNLGASRVPTSMNDSQGYGDLFQWGRGDDGH